MSTFSEMAEAWICANLQTMQPPPPIPGMSGRMANDDPAEWREPVAQWLAFACAFHPRAFGGVAALHLAYCEWEIARNEVPCIRETFEQILREKGFLLGVVSGTMLVSGLTFLEDVILPAQNVSLSKGCSNAKGWRR